MGVSGIYVTGSNGCVYWMLFGIQVQTASQNDRTISAKIEVVLERRNCRVKNIVSYSRAIHFLFLQRLCVCV